MLLKWEKINLWMYFLFLFHFKVYLVFPTEQHLYSVESLQHHLINSYAKRCLMLPCCPIQLQSRYHNFDELDTWGGTLKKSFPRWLIVCGVVVVVMGGEGIFSEQAAVRCFQQLTGLLPPPTAHAQAQLKRSRMHRSILNCDLCLFVLQMCSQTHLNPLNLLWYTPCAPSPRLQRFALRSAGFQPELLLEQFNAPPSCVLWLWQLLVCTGCLNFIKHLIQSYWLGICMFS